MVRLDPKRTVNPHAGLGAVIGNKYSIGRDQYGQYTINMFGFNND